MIKIKIKTWSCNNCGYKQDFEPTKKLLNIHFPQGVEEGYCPACYLGKNSKRMKMNKETNPTKKIEITIMGEDDIEDRIIDKEKEKKLKMNTKEKSSYRIKKKKDIKESLLKVKLLEDI